LWLTPLPCLGIYL